MEYRVPAGYGEAEIIEKKSRFIGRVWLTENEEEATARIKEMREQHWDATHNVYAYIIREGNIMRYSDDGEPQGTSGMPTLSVLRGEDVFNVCCVVTRYFGGTLLGTGGLVRAYSHTAKAALESAGIAVMRMWSRVTLTCTYAQFERMKTEIAAFDGITEDIDYGANIVITVLLPERKTKDFSTRIFDVTSGSVMPEKIDEEFRAARTEQKKNN